jgi:pimeloyl-ACP methyl ester carboxylesterase
VYLPDVRGSGRSTRLACAPQESAASPAGLTITSSEWEACLDRVRTEWGDRLAAFDVTNAAKDIAALAERVANGRDTFLYGAGYGSYLATRVLSVSEQPFAGVVYDSPCLPGSCKGSREDERYLGAGKRLMQACANDPTCRSKLGNDPWSRVGEALDAVDAERCAPLLELGIDRTAVRGLYASWLADPERLPLVPALTYRILRCAGGDARTLTKLATDLTGPVRVSPEERWASRVLGAHITLSELWETPAPSVDELFAIAESSHFSRGGGAAELASLRDAWPRYTDPLANTWPKRDVPTLVLSGSLDPDDALDEAARAELLRRGAALVELDGVTGGVALGARRRDGRSCGVEILGAFVDDPLSGLAHAHPCTGDLAPIAFDGSESLAESTFGSKDLWEPDP